MWLFTTGGFFSTVMDKMEPGRILIRARCEKDIKDLYTRYRKLCPSMRKPTSDELRDYRWRLGVTKADFVKLLAQLAEQIDYPNFKSAVHEREDQANKARPYLQIWGIMHSLQVEEDREYKQANRSEAVSEPRKRKADL
jgi:hypothetical protein